MKEVIIGYKDNVLDAYYDFMDTVENVKTVCKDMPTREKKSNSELYKGSDKYKLKDLKKSDKKLSAMISTIADWTKWSADVADSIVAVPEKFVICVGLAMGETLEFINDLIENGIEYAINWIMEKINGFINDKIIMRCLKYLKMITLYVKKYMLIAEKFVMEITKKMLESAKNGKFVAAMQTAMAAILMGLQILVGMISKILNLVDTYIMPLIMQLSIEGEGMAFFLTPKTVTLGNLKSETALADNFSCSEIILNIVYPAIDELDKQIKSAIKPVEAKSIEANMAIAAADVLISDTLPLPVTGNISNLTTDVLKDAARLIISMLGQPEPLPKFERLHPLNIRYMMWLAMFFEPAMKNAFGLPGYP